MASKYCSSCKAYKVVPHDSAYCPSCGTSFGTLTLKNGVVVIPGSSSTSMKETALALAKHADKTGASIKMSAEVGDIKFNAVYTPKPSSPPKAITPPRRRSPSPQIW